MPFRNKKTITKHGYGTPVVETRTDDAFLREIEAERLIYFTKMRRALIVLDNMKQIRQINPAGSRLFRCKPETVLNLKWPWKGLTFLREDGSRVPRRELPWENKQGRRSDAVMELGVYLNNTLLFWGMAEVDSTEHGMLLIFDDHTRQKQTEIRLLQSEKKYRTIFENIQDVYFEISMDGYIEELSPSVSKLCRVSPKSFIGHRIDSFFTDRNAQIRIIDMIMHEGHVEDETVILQRNQEKPRACSIMARLIHDDEGRPVKIVGSLRDITRRVRIEQQLQTDLEEKNVLLREIHHRVKNNMAIISSLLNIEEKAHPQTEMTEIFHELRNRITSMSLVHEHLYRSENLNRIEMPDYLKTLVQKIVRSYGPGLAVRSQFDIDPVTLKISDALYCGLIVNELVSNALKHAFNRIQQENILKIKMRRKGGTIVLEILDNGIGLPDDFQWEQTRSMGLKLVAILSREQLKGTLQVKKRKGAHFIVQFEE